MSPGSKRSGVPLQSRLTSFHVSNPSRRYPDDVYDRIWFPFNATLLGYPYTDLSAPDTAVITPYPIDAVYDTVPNDVLLTAMTDPTLINYTYTLDPTTYKQLYVNVFFAEVLEAGDS